MKLNEGNHTGQFITKIDENWKVYKTAKAYRVSAIEPVPGKANYSFAIANGHIDRHHALDSGKLKEDRDELYDAIDAFFLKYESAGDTKDDPYGDYARSKGQPLTPEQQWKRSVLFMRMRELEIVAAAKGRDGWEPGCRMSHSGVFKTKITDELLAETLAYIARRAGPIDMGALLQIERDYYGGVYRPDSCATFEAQLDLLAGRPEENINDLL